MVKVEFYQGEALLLPCRIKDRKTGKPMDLTGATFLLWVKMSKDADPVIVKTDSDFDVAGEASGYVTVFLTASDTMQRVGIYNAELRIITSTSPPTIEKLPFELKILEAITPNDWVLMPTGIVSLESFGIPVIT